VLVRVNAAAGTTAGAYTITVTGSGPNGTPVHKRTVSLNVGLVGISGITEIPSEYELSQNYPNPFNPVTKITYNLRERTNVKLSVYDVNGKWIETMNNGLQEKGSHFVYFDGATLSSGVYYYKLETDFFTDTKKMILLK
jgi:hypothetical protein